MTVINGQSRNPGDSTPSLMETIGSVVQRNLIRLNTSMPGNILSYNSATQRATVQPIFDRVFPDGASFRINPITNVPVQFPRSKNSFIHMPIDAGTPCLLIFSQRALDRWRESGDCVDPEYNRTHDLSDAMAIPGISSDSMNFNPGSSDNIVIKNSSGELVVCPDGKTSISSGSEELFQILTDLVKSLRAARTFTAAGPQPLIDQADPGFADIESRLATFLKG